MVSFPLNSTTEKELPHYFYYYCYYCYYY